MWIRYSWPALLWSLIILVLTLIPGKELPEVHIFQIDKVVHFFVFAVLMFLSSYGIVKYNDVIKKFAKPLLITSMYSIGFGITIEVLQQFVPGRAFSIADIIANSIGTGLGYLIFIAWRRNYLKR